MAKDKAAEAEYKAEGKRRMKLRQESRKLRSLVRQERNKWSKVWADSSSPTGYRQYCDYVGTCQAPCNGDC